MRDYHTHTYRCKHATGTIEDYARFAFENNFEVLGVTDHTPLPDNRFSKVRMDILELEDHIADFREAQRAFPQLKMILGMECEYLDQYHSFYKDELLGKWGIKYLVLGQHLLNWDGEVIYFWKEPQGPKAAKVYTEHLLKGMETGLFDFVAHPDIFGYFYEPWDREAIAYSRDILEAAVALKLPLEINGYGFRKGKVAYSTVTRYKYPLEQFWELAAQYDIEVVVNSDAHKPEDIGAVQKALELAKKLDLKFADLSFLEHR